VPSGRPDGRIKALTRAASNAQVFEGSRGEAAETATLMMRLVAESDP
jgi:hypothetical protein